MPPEYNEGYFFYVAVNEHLSPEESCQHELERESEEVAGSELVGSQRDHCGQDLFGLIALSLKVTELPDDSKCNRPVVSVQVG